MAAKFQSFNYEGSKDRQKLILTIISTTSLILTSIAGLNNETVAVKNNYVSLTRLQEENKSSITRLDEKIIKLEERIMELRGLIRINYTQSRLNAKDIEELEYEPLRRSKKPSKLKK